MEEINKVTEPPGKQLFRPTKFLKNQIKSIPVLKVQGKKLITNPKKCETLADNFQDKFQPTGSMTNAMAKKVNAEIRKLQEPVIDEYEVELFSMNNLKYCISRLKNSKAPGLDQVFNRCIKKFPDEALLLLLDVLNACLELEYFPDS